jgi:hypothetical protein
MPLLSVNGMSLTTDKNWVSLRSAKINLISILLRATLQELKASDFLFATQGPNAISLTDSRPCRQEGPVRGGEEVQQDAAQEIRGAQVSPLPTERKSGRMVNVACVIWCGAIRLLASWCSHAPSLEAMRCGCPAPNLTDAHSRSAVLFVDLFCSSAWTLAMLIFISSPCCLRRITASYPLFSPRPS